MFTSAGYPPSSVANLKFLTFWDGMFHAATYVFVLIGLGILWRAAHRAHIWWSGKMMIGTLLMGFGIFHLVEGIVDHHLLGIHHVNETAPPEQWLLWDLGFLLWGALMLAGGWALLRAGKRETAHLKEPANTTWQRNPAPAGDGALSVVDPLSLKDFGDTFFDPRHARFRLLGR